MEQLKKPKTILRAQHDARRNDVNQWKIAQKTDAPGGGWATFGSIWYATKEMAEMHIDRYVSAFPNEYEKD